LFSGFLAATFLLSIHLITRGRGMGLGDVKFAVLGGILVGINNLFIWMLLAFLTGAIVGIILILLGNAKLKSKIAFGPFLIIAIPITLMWGQKIYEIFF
jgi:prepilin signal peptidase PulO-like enzyme (type II secretory pathway)